MKLNMNHLVYNWPLINQINDHYKRLLVIKELNELSLKVKDKNVQKNNPSNN